MPKPSKYIPYYDDIIEAMGAPGCAFCKLQLRAAERYIDALLWESVNDPRIRREVSAARGFCNHHAWLLVRPGGALSSAIIYRDVVQSVTRIVLGAAPARRTTLWQRITRRLRPQRGADNRLAQALAPTQSCPVCLNATEIDAHLSSTVLVALAKSDDLLTHYRGSAGLCLHHFRTLLDHTHHADHHAALVAVQCEVWTALDGELAEFIRKNDHRFRGEPFGAERDAWERAIALTSGPLPAARSQRGGITQSSQP